MAVRSCNGSVDQYCSGAIFVDTASYIALVFGISMAVIFGVSRWWLRREKRQRKQADGSRPANA